MENSLFLFLVMISPWPIFFSILLFHGCFFDKSFKIFIYNKKQLYKYILYLLMAIVILGYIFFFRFWRNNRIFNATLYLKNANNFLLSQEPSSIILGSIFGIFWIIFFMLLLLYLSTFVKKVILALFLYALRYKVFYNFSGKPLNFFYELHIFFMLWVKKYTKNPTIIIWALRFWPDSFIAAENCIFRYIIPYLWLYDYMIHDGYISKVFMVLPWYFLYALGKQFLYYIIEIDTVENLVRAENFYGEPR